MSDFATQSQFEAGLAMWADDRRPLKCNRCGRFIAWADFFDGKATRYLLTPDSHFTREEYETDCGRHEP